MRFDVRDPAFRANPYPYYEQLRTHAPAYHWEAWDMWFFSRHDDVNALLRDPRLGRSANGGGDGGVEPPAEQRPLFAMMSHWMLLVDPPDHTRLRGLVQKAFTPRRIAELRGEITRSAGSLLDRAAEAGALELIADFAYRLPVNVICALLGVPAEDHVRFHAWSDAIARSLDFTEDPVVYNRAAAAAVELTGYFDELLAERRAQPREDLLSALVAAEEAGDRLTKDELFATCVLLLIAGHETTVNLIGNGTLALLRHPAQWRALQTDPSLAGTAVEELLRYDSPVQATGRTVTEPFEFRGIPLRAGSQVALLLGSANHDPAVFDAPHELNLTRAENRHLAFGGGIHYCLGAPLARLEGQIAFSTLTRRFPNLSLTGDTLAYKDNYTLRGLAALRLALG